MDGVASARPGEYTVALSRKGDLSAPGSHTPSKAAACSISPEQSDMF